ncbi:MAG TPA: helix-turn-helix domain-containing protein [Candidatus Dormibacteraeota bacterium]|nr:helix-turn-helix domain-containing protein [Candidatus Dormibacteraeota bacterium]
MAGPTGWLTLREACARLEVHPATLRQWADRGRVRAFRTPGGHRRFSAEDVQALVEALTAELPPDLDLLLSAALGRTRRDLGAGRFAGEPWYRLLDPGTRERYRQLGRELLVLVARSLAPGAEVEAALAGARRAAAEQGRLAAQAGLTVAEAARAHATFRDMLVESVLQMQAVQDQGRPVPDLVGAYRRVGGFLGEVLVAYLDAFTETGR